jgi:hypothetical protein
MAPFMLISVGVRNADPLAPLLTSLGDALHVLGRDVDDGNGRPAPSAQKSLSMYADSEKRACGVMLAACSPHQDGD